VTIVGTDGEEAGVVQHRAVAAALVAVAYTGAGLREQRSPRIAFEPGNGPVP
jgi:hypothetical protein